MVLANQTSKFSNHQNRRNFSQIFPWTLKLLNTDLYPFCQCTGCTLQSCDTFVKNQPVSMYWDRNTYPKPEWIKWVKFLAGKSWGHLLCKIGWKFGPPCHNFFFGKKLYCSFEYAKVSCGTNWWRIKRSTIKVAHWLGQLLLSISCEELSRQDKSVLFCLVLNICSRLAERLNRINQNGMFGSIGLIKSFPRKYSYSEYYSDRNVVHIS